MRPYSQAASRLLCIYVSVMILASCGYNKKSQPGKVNMTTADTSIILSYEQRLIEAYKNNGIDTITQLYHDDLIFNSPDGKILGKAEDIKKLRSGELVIQEYAPDHYTIKLIDDIAIVLVSIHIKGKVKGNGFEGDFSFIRVWKQQGEQWKLIAISGYPMNK